ncbi:O-antigen ligase [Desulfatibacillum alkenivorans DSM 16219]|uniref:O-antigen ligase n=1 Tax=Desulfatibacillum alkenivorans DSM 16219 TaxID=1121393 RepID=A0A1M6VF85_9BACT|nr:O-antigen ligase family protein [Desulfatibacillum alkenivorans]SHK80152.1 O-antigen ligase [Desulfatibacillum alkenivorans DSM 16219]
MDALREKFENGCDLVCLWAGALVPVGIVIGNVGFEAFAALASVAWILRSIVARDRTMERVADNPLTAPWMFWFGAILISLMVNGAGSKGALHDIAFVRFFLFGLAMLDVSNRRPVGPYLVGGLAAGVLFAAFNTILAYTIGVDMFARSLERYTGKLKEAARFSGLCAYACVFFVGWALGDRNILQNKKRLAILLFIAAIAFGQIVQTQVRTVVLAVLAGFVFIVFYGQGRKFGFKKVGLIAAGIFSLLGVAFYLGEWWNMESMYDRWVIWQVAVEIWKEHPAVGAGVGAFQDAFARISASGLVPPWEAPDGRVYFNVEQTHAHNLFLMIGACTGFLGLAAFGWLMVRACRLIYANPKGWRNGLPAWPVVLLVIGLTGFNIYHSWYHALFAFFLVLSGAKECPNNKNAS